MTLFETYKRYCPCLRTWSAFQSYRDRQRTLRDGPCRGNPAAPDHFQQPDLPESQSQTVADALPPLVSIPCPDPTAEDAAREKHIGHGQWLARQDRWQDLADAIRSADTAREQTLGAMSVAELLAFGARADVVEAVEHALMDGKPAKGAPLLNGIEALEEVLDQDCDDPMIACIVAQAHIDLAWAWRGTGWAADVPKRNYDAFDAHFERAIAIMTPLISNDSGSPFVATTICALAACGKCSTQSISDAYEDLILLNPNNPRAMRSMGNMLLPRWFGSYQDLELQARRISALTVDVLGAGAYTWIMFDAIAIDDGACEYVDVEFFIEGLHDILERTDSPYIGNLLAAYCGNAIGQSFSGSDVADQVRARIADCAGWIVRHHLTELHPMTWAHAARGFENTYRVRSATRFADTGYADAIRILKGLFSREIAAGKRIVFTTNGPEAHSLPAAQTG